MSQNFFTLELWTPEGFKEVERVPNLNPTGGKNYALDCIFDDAIPEANWYLGLIDGSGSPVLAAADTLASHSGWSEITSLSAPRVIWVPGAAVSGQKTGAVVVFTASGNITIGGAFVCSVISGTTGILYAEALFTNTYDLVSSNTFNVTYTAKGI